MTTEVSVNMSRDIPATGTPLIGEKPGPVEPWEPGPSRKGLLLKRVALFLVVPVAGMAIWQYVGDRGLLADGLFPSASKTALAIWDFVVGSADSNSPYSGQWLESVRASSIRILAGFVIGSLLGVFLGLMSGYYRSARDAINPTVNALRPISITAWIPLALIVLGIGDQPAIFLTALASFFPVYINTFLGAAYTDGGLVRAARMLGATNRRILFAVTLPASLPSIATGLRVAVALAWTTVVVAEMLGSSSGIGYVLIDSYNQFRLDYVIACMVSLGVLGTISDKILALLFRPKLRWAEHGGVGS